MVENSNNRTNFGSLSSDASHESAQSAANPLAQSQSRSREETEKAFMSVNRKFAESIAPTFIVQNEQPQIEERIVIIRN